MTDQTSTDDTAPDPGPALDARPSEKDVAADLQAKGGSATEVDVKELLAGLRSMQARIDSLEAERAAGKPSALGGTVETLAGLLRTHASQTPGIDHTEVLGHVDDLAAAAKDAVQTGDVSHVVAIGQRIGRWLDRHNPGPGDQHYYQQAKDFAGPHLEDAVAALDVTPAHAEIGTDKPAPKVLQGNVTG